VTILFFLLLLPVLALGFTGLTLMFLDVLHLGSRSRAEWARDGLAFVFGFLSLAGLVWDIASGELFRTESFTMFLGIYGMNFVLLGIAFMLLALPHQSARREG
jgi:hypothetical protein